MFSTIFSTIGLPIIMRIIGEALGQINNPLAKTAAEALGNLNQAVDQGKLTQEEVTEANRHAEKMAELEFQNNQAELTEINTTMRQELASEDKYIRRMRPTFGYIMALSWFAQMLGIAYIIVFDTTKSVIVLNAMSSLSMIWTIGLSVLGIYVYKRSDEKKVQGKETIYWNEKK